MLVQELTFWSLFFLFNFLTFSLNTLLRFEPYLLIPFRGITKKGQRGIFIDLESDFYKFFFEISILIILTRWFNWGNPVLVIIAAYYGFTFIYNTYHYAFSKIYQVLPILGNDLRLIKNGVAILWAES